MLTSAGQPDNARSCSRRNRPEPGKGPRAKSTRSASTNAFGSLHEGHRETHRDRGPEAPARERAGPDPAESIADSDRRCGGTFGGGSIGSVRLPTAQAGACEGAKRHAAQEDGNGGENEPAGGWPTAEHEGHERNEAPEKADQCAGQAPP